ncbi:MAG: SCO family protein [Bacteroidetes bacterium]|nr:SCO family protein [Bacteroidota bacterium]
MKLNENNIKCKLVYKSIFILAALLAATLGCSKQKHQTFLLPIIGEKHLSNTDTIYHTINNFEFKNQYGEIISDKTTANKIYVADFFFATCQSICPHMSTNLKEVQKEFLKNSDFLILSHTVNPLHDSVEVLNAYAQTYGAIKNKWHFLTGNKKKIYDLAAESYLINAVEDKESKELFLHSELFLLIDKQKRIRGTYDGTDLAQVSKLIADVKLLYKEDSLNVKIKL